MSIIIWLAITIGFIFLFYKAIKGSLGGGKISETGSMICPSCGTRGEPKQATQGSTGIELVLWICFIVPGLIYSFWRLSSSHPVCPSCGRPGMIAIATPRGQQLLKQF
jgi:hypothetical protein